jgi:hypothetical protein
MFQKLAARISSMFPWRSATFFSGLLNHLVR